MALFYGTVYKHNCTDTHRTLYLKTHPFLRMSQSWKNKEDFFYFFLSLLTQAILIEIYISYSRDLFNLSKGNNVLYNTILHKHKL